MKRFLLSLLVLLLVSLVFINFLAIDDILHGVSVALVLIAFLSVMGAIGAAIGTNKGRVKVAFIFGFFLGPIGWLIIAMGKSHVQRVMELKQALDSGAISQAEFDQQKSKLL